jgi:hypothetical protein
MARFVKTICLGGALLLLFAGITLRAQQNPQRLILKDGSYQTVTKWQVVGTRVRYYSAERYSWEELPNDMVDWPATEQYNKERDTERAKNVEAIAKADEADQIDRPLVAPGLRLPDAGGIFLLDTYKDQPQLIELSQQGGELNKHTGKNVLRAAVNPLSLSSKQTIELKGARAHTQAHVAQPVIFASVDTIGAQSQDAASALATAGKGRSSSAPAPASAQDTATPPERYALVRMEKIKDTRVIGSMNVTVTGKVSQKQNLVKVTTTPLGKSWIKITPAEPLTPGEYAVVELLDQGQINLYVWDFGVDPSAPANSNAWTAQQPEPGQNGTNPGLTKRPPN